MTEFTTWRSLVDGQEISAIPDSVINQHLVENFSTSEWTDDIGNLDLTTISGLSEDSSAFDGAGGVESPSSNDHATGATFDFIESNYYGEWAFSFGFSTEDNNGWWFGINDENDGFDDLILCGVGRDFTDDKLGLSRRFDGNDITKVESDVSVNDGSEYVVLIQSTGPTASDLEIYFKPDEQSDKILETGQDGTDDKEFNSTEFVYFARNNEGSIEEGIEGLLNDPRWFDSSLDKSDRETVFAEYDWYDPSTDAP